YESADGPRRNLQLAEKTGADHHIREPRFDRAAVSQELPAGLQICTRSAGGDRRGYGRRLCSSYWKASAAEFAYVSWNRSWHGQHHDGITEQNASHHYGGSTNTRDDPLRSISYQ